MAEQKKLTELCRTGTQHLAISEVLKQYHKAAANVILNNKFILWAKTNCLFQIVLDFQRNLAECPKQHCERNEYSIGSRI